MTIADLTADDVRNMVAESGIHFLPVHECSICRYQCGYLFKGEQVGYDAGCDCVTYINIRESSWADVADHHNRQKDVWRKKIRAMLTKKPELVS